jgi:uncharacterized protein (UPF0261 family)
MVIEQAKVKAQELEYLASVTPDSEAAGVMVPSAKRQQEKFPDEEEGKRLMQELLQQAAQAFVGTSDATALAIMHGLQQVFLFLFCLVRSCVCAASVRFKQQPFASAVGERSSPLNSRSVFAIKYQYIFLNDK